MITLQKEIVQGWGRAASVQSLVGRPDDVDGLAECLRECARNHLPVAIRGGGNSYGDLITNRDGVILDLSRLDRIISADWQQGVVVVEPGVPLGRIIDESLPHGWVLGVVPGSPFVTVGGAIGNNVHGKNAFVRGNFESCVRALQVMAADGTIHTVSRDENAELFRAVIAGLGLYGIIIEATLALASVKSPYLEVELIRFADADEMVALFDQSMAEWEMVVAWMDAFNVDGRGVVERGRWIDRPANAADDTLSALSAVHAGTIVRHLMAAAARPFLGRPLVATANATFYQFTAKLPSRRIQHFARFNFIVSRYVPEPPLLYPGGMVEIQILIPVMNAASSIKRVIALCISFGMESWWCGIKRHRADDYLLSFSGDGYSYSVNLPGRHTRSAQFPLFVDELVSAVAALGGRVYVGKDQVLRPEHIASMFAERGAFAKMRHRLDPKGVFDNDLARRLLSR